MKLDPKAELKEGTVFDISLNNTIIRAVILHVDSHIVEGDWTDTLYEKAVCYGQNKLFILSRISECWYQYDEDFDGYVIKPEPDCEPAITVLVDYCVIPEYEML